MAHLPRRDATFTHQLSATTAALQQTSPSTRVTRSSARLAEASPSTQSVESSQPPNRAASNRKRKASAQHDLNPPDDDLELSPSRIAVRKAKRPKTSGAPQHSTSANRPIRRRSNNNEPAMSSNASSSKLTDNTAKADKTLQKQVSSRGNKKSGGGERHKADTSSGGLQEIDTTPPIDNSARRSKKRPSKKDDDTYMNQDNDLQQTTKSTKQESDIHPSPPSQPLETNEELSPGEAEDDGQDPFTTALFGRGAPPGLSSTLRALSGMMSGMSARLRDILNNLRLVENRTMQFVALEELSNLLLVSNEDNLSGQFSPDPYVKELVALMQPNPITGEENPEMMLLACRCIANLMEALRGSVANVVYGGAVPVLCQKLLDIQYIDVAEQALSTLSKVSIDFPASIVREGGLTACLQFLDFFATGTQRTAVMTAANCCRNIPHDSFPVILDVMPILQNVLASHDQKVVEQGCLCVTRIIDSFKHSADKLESLVDVPLLKAILGLLLPGTTNLIGSKIHTEFLRVLAIIARASPKLSTELLKMNVVDTLYQILTGVSPPSDTTDAASKIDSVIIMQALIHRPREQIYETLNVICELLPRSKAGSTFSGTMHGIEDDSPSERSDLASGKKSHTEKRLELLKECSKETRRFAMILLPTLTDAYSSTVNLSVRQKVLNAQLKILSHIETSVIEEALRPVPYASFLASILSQEDHPSLVMSALQASELLFERLENIYQYQFYREGVISEVKKLGARSLEADQTSTSAQNKSRTSHEKQTASSTVSPSDPRLQKKVDDDQNVIDDADDNDDDDDDQEDDDEDDENDEVEDEDEIIVRDDAELDESHSSDSSEEEITSPLAISGIKDLVIVRARRFLECFDTQTGRDAKLKAYEIRDSLRVLADSISSHYASTISDKQGHLLFDKLGRYFEGDALDSITSSELLDSGIIRVLVEVLSLKTEACGTARSDFILAFMGSTNSTTASASTASNTTAFSILIQKLQDLLSRAEHFEVLTVNSNASESSRTNSTSMLSRQIRLKLSAGADSEIPLSYREMIVSIHAIATFKALDDYLRPRISISERPASGQRRREMLQQLANARMAQLANAAESGMFSPFGSELGFIQPPIPSTGSNRSASRPSSRSKPAGQEYEESNETKSEPKRKKSSRAGLTAAAESSGFDQSTDPSIDDTTQNLECVDEKSIDQGQTDADESRHEALDAVVGELEEDISENEAEPGAVNMEIGSSGKVTARDDDGTRIYTPQQPGTPVQGLPRPAPGQPLVVPGPRDQVKSTRPSSTIASAPKADDWHIEFSIDDKAIPHNTTIYRAIHHNRDQPQETINRGIWSTIHSIKFKKVKGPPPADNDLGKDAAEKRGPNERLPPALDGHPNTSSILSLLGLLHELNASLEDVPENISGTRLDLNAEPLTSFINTKLTAKMNRQLEEPLIVASNCLPIWSEDLARTFPFLFPFETRHLFLQSTSFGYSRSITRWQNNQEQNDDRRDRRRDDRPIMGRPQRQKVRISRSRILESAMKVMEMYGASPSVLEVEYFEEVGTGLGPTLEFYSTVSREFSKKKLKMWRENNSPDKDPYAFGKNGLFPAPLRKEDVANEKGQKLLHFFKMLGKFVARSMLDSRIIDVNFSPTFFKIGSNVGALPSIALLRTVDPGLANSLSQLQQLANLQLELEAHHSWSIDSKAAISLSSTKGPMVEDLMLDFTLPGYDIELISGGTDIIVTNKNVDEYISLVLDYTVGQGVRHQVEAFQSGFSQVFSYSSLQAFTPNELVMLFGRVEEDWSLETLMDSVKADHGFNMDSKSVKNLLQTMCELSKQQRRDFLQFVTGSPKLPIGGFKNLTPMFTVVCKPSEPPYTSDDYLPSVMTCVNYLKLPDYSSQEVMRKRLDVAIREGQGAFHLS